MNQDNGTIQSQDNATTPLILEESIDKPSVSLVTWIAVGNMLFWLIAFGIAYFLDPKIKAWNTYTSATLGMLLGSGGLLVVHSFGAASKNLLFPRTTRFEGDTVTITLPGRSTQLNLRNCYWYKAVCHVDSVWFHWRGQPRLILQEKRTNNTITCGRTQAMRDSLAGFLRQIEVPEGRPKTAARWFWILVGILAGLALAQVLPSFVAENLKIQKPSATVIKWYCWLFFPIIGGLYASVLAGNDYFQFNRCRSLWIMFDVFLGLGCFFAVILVGKANFFVWVGLGLLNGLIGVGIAYYLALWGERRRRVYLFKNDQIPESIGNFK